MKKAEPSTHAKIGKEPRPASPALADEIAEWLREQIREGHLGVGDRLATERELGEQFDVSRTVIREALAKIKADGLVVSRQGSGVFVTASHSRSSFRLGAIELGQREGLAHIIELLVTVEVGATRMAALRRTPAELKRIRQALIGIEYAIVQDRLGDEEDFQFHRAIFAATHNPHFIALGEYLEAGVRRLIRSARANTAKNYEHLIQAVQKEHEAIYEAIESKDAAKAASAADTHLRNAAKRLTLYRQNNANL